MHKFPLLPLPGKRNTDRDFPSSYLPEGSSKRTLLVKFPRFILPRKSVVINDTRKRFVNLSFHFESNRTPMLYRINAYRINRSKSLIKTDATRQEVGRKSHSKNRGAKNLRRYRSGSILPPSCRRFAERLFHRLHGHRLRINVTKRACVSREKEREGRIQSDPPAPRQGKHVTGFTGGRIRVKYIITMARRFLEYAIPIPWEEARSLSGGVCLRNAVNIPFPSMHGLTRLFR